MIFKLAIQTSSMSESAKVSICMQEKHRRHSETKHNILETINAGTQKRKLLSVLEGSSSDQLLNTDLSEQHITSNIYIHIN